MSRRITPAERTAVVRRALAGESIEALAVECGRSPATVRSWLSYYNHRELPAYADMFTAPILVEDRAVVPNDEVLSLYERLRRAMLVLQVHARDRMDRVVAVAEAYAAAYAHPGEPDYEFRERLSRINDPKPETN